MLPDGNFSADIMIVGERPFESDSNIGIILSGSIEIMSSDCECCENLRTCASEKFLVKCNKSIDPFVSNWENTELFPMSSADILSRIALDTSEGLPFNFRFVRNSWFKLFDRMNVKATYKRTAYVTTLYKKFNDELPNLAWLKLERELCSNISLVITLGKPVFDAIVKDGESYEDVIGQVIVTEEWGNVLVFPSLEELNEDPENSVRVAIGLLDKALGEGHEESCDATG
jgi:hypothetical protein